MRGVFTLIALLLLAPAAGAAGAWSDKAAGGVVSIGRQLLVGRALHSPHHLPATAKATRLAWRIELLSPPPPGLQIKLCHTSRCLALPALAGQLSADSALPASGEFHFIYTVEHSGPLVPPLNVVNNALTLNYR